MTKILFIVNPTSGLSDKSNTESVISGFEEEYKFRWEIYYTEKTGTAAKIQKKIREYKPDKVVAAGGDGTINQVATELLDSKIELGIIPAGSANGLAYNLGLPSGIKEAMEIILNSSAKPIDVIRLNENIYCYHLSDIGTNARIVKRFEAEGSKGLAGYGRQMIKELFSRRTAFSFKLETSSIHKKYTAEMLFIANARKFGTGAIINPLGSMDDGEFEIVIIKPYPWWIFFYLLRMVFFGKLDNMKYLRIIKASKAMISFDKPQDLQTDGEIIADIKSLDIKIKPSALKVFY